jgi:Zn-dependent protease/CBS domain-containing protein
MKGTLKIGKIAGIGLFIHWTFLILIAFIIYVNYKAGHNLTQILWSIFFILTIFVTVLLHELGHALAAKRYKLQTTDITLLPIGGLARLEKLPEKPSEELVVALAGPLVNIAIAFITSLFIQIPANSADLISQLSVGINSSTFFLNFFIVNVWLALFNLIPAFPMDGGRVLRAILSYRLKRHIATKIAARIGQVLALGFIFIGIFYNPFLVIIGIFVIMAAQIETNYTDSKYLLKGYKVRDIVIQNFLSLDSKETLATATQLLLNSQSKDFLITKDGRASGTLNRDEIITALSQKKENSSLETIMNTNLVYLDANSLLEDAFETIYKNKSSLLLVLENQELIGILDTENLLEFILIKEVKSKKIDGD